ncbi:hypothetical protein [Humisphaera borealis]|uniref:Uncharacterized protein n=1 Tax=Humisphaera borealis TaxID=2807512 RepID=A0A7M2WV65_9BACT|nr:hypothetical protein [Humisphaera borealis]QOV89112.1 hypothetical protein IPV69_23295 [Humisphaera borealis]
MKIEQVPGLERAKLIIPKKLLPGAKEEKADAGMSPARTAIAGIAISGAVALLGLQFIRRRSGTPGRSSTLMLVAGGVGLALVSAAAMADIAIPGQPRRPRPVPPEPPVVLPAGVPVTISVVDTGDEVILQIAPEHVAPTPKPLPGLNAPHVEPGQKPAPSGLTPPPPPG